MGRNCRPRRRAGRPSAGVPRRNGKTSATPESGMEALSPPPHLAFLTGPEARQERGKQAAEVCSSVPEALETTVTCVPGPAGTCLRWEAAHGGTCVHVTYCSLGQADAPTTELDSPSPNGKDPPQPARRSFLMLTACSLAGRIHFCEQKNPSVLQAAAGWQAYKLLVTAP